MIQPCVQTQTVGQPLSEAELRTLMSLNAPAPPPLPKLDFLPTPEQIRREIQGMLGQPLSPYFKGWVEGYARVGRRNPYLWSWCRQAVNVSTLPCVDPAWREELCDVKTLGVMWDVLLDDVADQGGRPELLDMLLGLTLGQEVDLDRVAPADREYARFTVELWNEIMGQSRRYPRHAEFADLLRFDYLQLCNVMRYSHLLNAHPEMLNLVEHDNFTPYNMHIMICSTFDVMCSPTFDKSEIGRLREVIYRAQWMGRIGNLVTTWQRELGEKDFTSGVYARAVMRGDVTIAQLQQGDRESVEKAILRGRNEEFFLRRWKRNRDFLLSERARLKSFDVRPLVTGFERLICLHLGSRGYK